MSVDPFTRASATYRNAMRYGHKSGAAYEGWIPRPGIAWGRVLNVAACAGFWLGFAAVVAVLVSIKG